MDDVDNIILIKDKEIQSITDRYENDIESLCMIVIEREKLINEMENTILVIDDKYKLLENELKNERNDNKTLRLKVRDMQSKLQQYEDTIDLQQNEIIELKHNNITVDNNKSSKGNNQKISLSSPVDNSKKKKNNTNNNNNNEELLDAAKLALSLSPSSSPRSLNSSSNDYEVVNTNSTKLTKNPLTMKPSPKLVKEVGTNESRLEQLLKQNNDTTNKWSEFKKHDRLFESRNILNKKSHSNDSNDDYNTKTKNNHQGYDDIEEKDIEKYKPPLPPKYKNKDDDDNNSDTKLSNRITKSIFRTASNVIKGGLSSTTRRSWDSRSPSPVGDNSDTRSNNSDRSNASHMSRSSNNSTRGRLLAGIKKHDITIYPTDNDDDLDVSYI